MAKSRHRKGHKEKVAKFKTKIKKDQELLKKRLLDNYINQQKEMLAKQEDHTSTQEVTGPEIDIQGLNEMPEINLDESIIEGEAVNVSELNVENEDDNNNK